MIHSSKILRVTLLAASVATTLAFVGCSSTSMSMPMSNSNVASFGASLSGASEVPPNATAGSGTLTATLDKSTSVLKWKLTYSGLTGPATMAHFHGPAMPGTNAGVVVPFPSPASPAEGQTTLSAAQVADLMAGKWYTNVHTAANPGGEIRGQVMVK
jgi:CHRD domain